ncbi:hypothetical protein ABWH96_01020 [Marivirga tractuosa]|uniref:hypothetical protein n=1 Tax=Marivirga tractuosa TaxID=1006 RepID=UPI0035CF95E4
MSNIIETTHLEYNKSAFLIDLIKHDNGDYFIELLQSIDSGNKSEQSIKINPTLIEDIVNVLKKYLEQIPESQKEAKNHITAVDQREILKRYFKGVSIKDLSIQFNSNQEDIKSILRNKNIAIVSNKPIKKRYWRKKKK